MIEIDLTTWFVATLITYGPVLLGSVLFIGALGVPLPGTLFLLATGASPASSSTLSLSPPT